MEMTTDEEEVVVSLHDLLVGGARLLDGSEVSAMAYKDKDIHAADTNITIEQTPRPAGDVLPRACLSNTPVEFSCRPRKRGR